MPLLLTNSTGVHFVSLVRLYIGMSRNRLESTMPTKSTTEGVADDNNQDIRIPVS